MRTAGVLRTAAVFLAIIIMALPAVAQDEPDEVAWQAVISHQIQAFRDGDAPEAFFDAGRMFHAMFPDPYAFFAAIITSGYAPIMESTSHSFGGYRMTGDEEVVQAVRLEVKAQDFYDALYQLRIEDGVWRVQGVVLQKSGAIGV